MRIRTQPIPTNKPILDSDGYSLIELLVVISIIAVLVSLILPANRSVGPTAYRAECRNHLKQIALALHNYESDWGAFPPAFTVDATGKPLHSWRTLILPYMDQPPLYKRIDLAKAWNDPVNLDAYNTIVHTYRCPGSSAPPSHTTYLAIVTPKSCLQPGKPRLKSDIKDDLGETITVIEVGSDQAVHWMSPMDADEAIVLALSSKTKLPHSGGINAVNVDGTMESLSMDLPAAERLARISIAGGEKVNP